MSASDSISNAILAARTQGRTALVGFLTGGFPSRAAFKKNFLAVAECCDVVEVGVPFSDPMADGTTIQRASAVALADGVTLPWILEELTAMTPRPVTPVLLMSYLNPLLAFGLDRLPQAALAAGVSGFIVPDLPFEESGDLRQALERAGIALVQMVTPVTPADRLEKLCAGARGFIYAVTMTGTTGKDAGMADAALDYMQRVKRAARIPVCAGFGIRTREQVERLGAHVDGVIVGSALVEILESCGDPRQFLRTLRGS